MRKTLLTLLISATLGVSLPAQTAGSAAGSLASLLESLGTQWKVHEQYKPDWDLSGTWTREGSSTVYVAHYVNAGRSAVKTADFRVTAESYANGVLRLRHPQNGYYEIPVKPGDRVAAGKTSWCPFVGCSVEIQFAGTTGTTGGVQSTGTTGSASAPTAPSFAGRWSLNADGFLFVMDLEVDNGVVRGRMTPSGHSEPPSTVEGTVRGREIVFRRITPGLLTQEYHGFIFNRSSGHTMGGMFEHNKAWTYGWYATK